MYNPDRPVTDRTLDELGLAAVADAVAERIVELQPADGLVIGLQSPWGMGKSTFLGFLTETLEKEPRTVIVRFAPWLVDDRNALLHELFAGLSHGLEVPEKRHASRWDVQENKKRREVAQGLRRFVRLADRLRSLPQAPHISLAKDALDLPGLREVSSIGRFLVSSVAAFKPKDETLRQLRDEICTRLRLLNFKIIVVIDDIDRLEQAEAREVFRLVRAVADFPNTTYLVAFDREPLDAGAAGVEHDIARSFLDKIIQVPIFLPEPEAVDLRRMLGQTLERVLGRALREADSINRTDSEKRRLEEALDPLVRTYLNSPRRIGIIDNILKTLWPAVSDDVDMSDFLIHLCLANFDRPLADWVDDYLAVRRSRHRSRFSGPVLADLRASLERLLRARLRYREDRLTLLRMLLPTLRGY